MKVAAMKSTGEDLKVMAIEQKLKLYFLSAYLKLPCEDRRFLGCLLYWCVVDHTTLIKRGHLNSNYVYRSL